jgi:ABC-2 type transport system ATP-binding protein
MAFLVVKWTRMARTTALPLELKGIVKRWRGSPRVLEGVDLEVEAGAAVAVSGRNGAGKTTLLRIAGGLIAPESGTVRVNGLDPERERTEFQQQAGLLSAGNSGLYGRLKAEQHLDMWVRVALIPRRDRTGAIGRVTGMFDLEPLFGKRVDRLSMGQRQRLRLALAFLHDPQVVLLDEPDTSLDDEGLLLLGRALEELKAAGGAALVCVPSGWERVPALDGGYVLSDGLLEAA